MKRRIALVSLVFLLLTAVCLGSIAGGCGDGELPGGAVAKVGDVYISGEEFNQTFARESVYYGVNDQTPREAYREVQTYILENMVNNLVAHMEAETRGLVVTDDEVQAEVDKYAAYYGGDLTKFEEELAKAGDTLETFKEQAREGLERQKVYDDVTKEVTTVPDADVTAYYEENKADYYVEPSRVVRHILIIPTPGGTGEAPSTTTSVSVTAPVGGPITQADWDAALTTAKDVRSKLTAGGDWQELARQYSGDPVTKDSGGELGTVRLGQTLEAFETAAFSLELDEISEPVQTPYGYEIIQVTSITVGGQQTLEEKRPEIESTLLAEAQTKVWTDWIERKKAELGVVYREDLRPTTTTTTVEDTTTLVPSGADPGGTAPEVDDSGDGSSQGPTTTP